MTKKKAWDPFGGPAGELVQDPAPLRPDGDYILLLQSTALRHARELSALRGLVEVQSELLDEVRSGLALLAGAVLKPLAGLDGSDPAAGPVLGEVDLVEVEAAGWSHLSPATGALVRAGDIPGFGEGGPRAARAGIACPRCGAVPKGHPADGPCPACGFVFGDDDDEDTE